MKIYDEVSIDTSGLNLAASDLSLIAILDQCRYFTSRYFILEFETEVELQFVNLYVRAYENECSEVEAIQIPLIRVAGDGLGRILICNFHHTQHEFSSDFRDFLEEYESRSDAKLPHVEEIDLEKTAYDEVRCDSLLLKAMEFAKKNGLFEVSEGMVMSIADKQAEYERQRRESVSRENKSNYESLDVSFLD